MRVCNTIESWLWTPRQGKVIRCGELRQPQLDCQSCTKTGLGFGTSLNWKRRVKACFSGQRENTLSRVYLSQLEWMAYWIVWIDRTSQENLEAIHPSYSLRVMTWSSWNSTWRVFACRRQCKHVDYSICVQVWLCDFCKRYRCNDWTSTGPIWALIIREQTTWKRSA